MSWCRPFRRSTAHNFAHRTGSIRRPAILLGFVAMTALWAAPFAARADSLDGAGDGLELEKVANLMHDIVAANREAYSQIVVNRLMIQEKVIRSDEHYVENKALLLPTHFFRLAAELSAKKNSRAVYSLQSFWAIRRENMPKTELEKIGLARVLGGTDAFYGTEGAEGAKYFIAAYPDAATNQACVTCHNNHPESRRQDFAVGDVMGGLVVRIPLRPGDGQVKGKAGTDATRPLKMNYQEVADLVNAITAANREVYTTLVSERLTEKQHVLATDEHYLEKKCLPLAVQLFNAGALLANSRTRTATYALRSYWPINKGSQPASPVEKAGLTATAAGKDRFYGIETSGAVRTLVAVYPDKAVDEGCVTCHNGHPNSPRRDFKLGTVMGGVVVRVPMTD
jgi:Protein of unknown function (DUF3365)